MRPFLLLAASLIAFSGVAVDARRLPADPSLKAAFLLNFARLTTWPADVLPAGEPLLLCVTDPEIRTALAELAEGRVIDGRPLRVVRTFAEAPSSTCHVVYASRLDETGVGRLLAWVGSGSILTVGDTGFASRGGMIEFFVGDGQLRFAVNRQAAQRARLRFSARLLGLARLVTERP